MPWPFLRAKPAGWVNNDVPTHSELNLMDEQIAQAADGATWSDVAAIATLPHAFTNSAGGRFALWNPVLRKFFSFNVSSGDPLGWRSNNPFETLTSLTLPTTPGCDITDVAVNPSTGNMIVVGHLYSSSQGRVRQSTDGVTWTTRNTAKSASVLGPSSCLYCGGSINKFFLGFGASGGGAGEIESSPDGITWTNLTVPNTFERKTPAFSPTLNRILWARETSGTYVTSDDGVSWTQRTAPWGGCSLATWNSHFGKFFIFDNTSGTFGMWSSPDGISWSTVIPLTGFSSGGTHGTRLFSRGRLMGLTLGSELVVSVDQFANTVRVAELSGSAHAIALGDYQLLLANPANGKHWVSQRIGL
jgi:hypothetical protein